LADYVELRVGMMAGDKSDRHADLGKEIHALSSASKPYAAFFARGMPRARGGKPMAHCRTHAALRMAA